MVASNQKKRFRIPILSSLAEYTGIFYRFIGFHIVTLGAISFVATMVESVGITLFLPLFTAGFEASAVGEENRAAEIVHMVFGFFGVTPTPQATIVFILAFFLIKMLIKIGEGGYRSILIARMGKTLRRRMMQQFSNIAYTYYVRTNTGHLTNVLTIEVERMVQGFATFSDLLVRMVTIVSLLGFAFFVYWQFTVMAAAFSIFVFVIMRVLVKQTQRYSKRLTAERGEFQSLLIQIVQAFKYVRATGRLKALLDRLQRSIERVSDFWAHLVFRAAIVDASKEPLMILFIVALMGYQLLIVGGSIAAIAIFLAFFLRIIQAVLQFQGYWNGFVATTGSINETIKTMDLLQKHQDPEGAVVLEHFRSDIRLISVSFAYTDRDVLRNISLTIPKNTTVAFVGRSGAGKSTLVDMIAGLLLPKQGQLLIDGVPITAINRQSWQEKIGYVTQDPVVFNDTVANNISLWSCDPKDPECARRIQTAAEMAYCQTFIESLPEGYSTLVGDRGIKLSGGQKQRLAIARELFKNPELLILDEATSALDTESERAIQQSIDALKGKLTVIVIAHRLSTVRNADIIYVLEDGEIVESGTFEELLQQNGVFRRMVEMQALIVTESIV